MPYNKVFVFSRFYAKSKLNEIPFLNEIEFECEEFIWLEIIAEQIRHANFIIKFLLFFSIQNWLPQARQNLICIFRVAVFGLDKVIQCFFK